MQNISCVMQLKGFQFSNFLTNINKIFSFLSQTCYELFNVEHQS
jgi:hypothetical protein